MATIQQVKCPKCSSELILTQSDVTNTWGAYCTKCNWNKHGRTDDP